VRHKIRHDTSDSEEEDDDDDATEEQDNKSSTHHRWKSIWRQPASVTQDPHIFSPKKWVKETAKGQRTTVMDYAKILNILRAL